MSINEVKVNPLVVHTIIELQSVEFDAVSTTTEMSAVEEECCRICHCGREEEELIYPCKCHGSLQFVHPTCLNTWLNMPAKTNKKQCELCNFNYLFKTEPKPFLEWKKLELTEPERQRLVGLIAFTFLVLITVISTTAIIVRWLIAAIKLLDEEVNMNFLIKTGCICFVFFGSVYIIGSRCRIYLTYFNRWRDFNQVVFVSDISKQRLT